MPMAPRRLQDSAHPAVLHLNLTRFRNYRALRLALPDQPLFFYGPNGAGKTNLLEAVSFLTLGTGLRRAKLAEIAHKNADHWGLVARIGFPPLADRIEIRTGITAQAPSKRLLQLNDAPLSHQAALLTYLSVVWMAPQMNRFFYDGGSYRRRFLDQTVSLYAPAHRAHLSRYERALRERTALLTRDPGQSTWCDSLETTLAEVGTTIAATRLDVIRRLHLLLEGEAIAPLSPCHLHLTGQIEDSLHNRSALEVEEAFARQLREDRVTDIHSAQQGHSARCGPHRSTFDLSLKRARGTIPGMQGSTGEQKAMILALALATASLLHQQTGRAPILLLDDALAHLDQANRAALLTYVRHRVGQTWMTGTTASRSKDFARLQVGEGTVTLGGTHRKSTNKPAKRPRPIALNKRSGKQLGE
ncbi:MAG: DNA replication and repair protein RecF [Pseudomonadota bacterium]